MLKIVLAQWMNTAFIIYFINGIDEAPNEDYISQVCQSVARSPIPSVRLDSYGRQGLLSCLLLC